MNFKVGQRVKISEFGETAFRIVLKVDENDNHQPVQVDPLKGELSDHGRWPPSDIITLCSDARDPNRLP